MRKTFLTIASLLALSVGTVYALDPPRWCGANSSAEMAGKKSGPRKGKKLGPQDGSGPIHQPGTGGGNGGGQRRGRR